MRTLGNGACAPAMRWQNWLRGIAVLSLVFIMGGLSVSVAVAETSAWGRVIIVKGKGVVTATPDVGQITAGVSTEGKTAATAMRANSDAMRDVIGTLKEAGINGRDIQTSNLSVQPRQQHFRDGRPPRVTGYQVVNQVHITARDLDKLGDILDRVVVAGANQIHGISFHVSTQDKLKDEARGAAIKDARRKAELYAAAAGARVGQVVAITEQGSSGGHQPVRMARMSAESVPIERGSQTLEVRVSVTWSLK